MTKYALVFFTLHLFQPAHAEWRLMESVDKFTDKTVRVAYTKAANANTLLLSVNEKGAITLSFTTPESGGPIIDGNRSAKYRVDKFGARDFRTTAWSPHHIRSILGQVSPTFVNEQIIELAEGSTLLIRYPVFGSTYNDSEFDISGVISAMVYVLNQSNIATSVDLSNAIQTSIVVQSKKKKCEENAINENFSACMSKK